MSININLNILITNVTAAQNETELSYRRMRGLYFLAVIFVATIISMLKVRILSYFIKVQSVSIMKLICKAPQFVSYSIHIFAHLQCLLRELMEVYRDLLGSSMPYFVFFNKS